MNTPFPQTLVRLFKRIQVSTGSGRVAGTFPTRLTELFTDKVSQGIHG